MRGLVGNLLRRAGLLGDVERSTGAVNCSSTISRFGTVRGTEPVSPIMLGRLAVSCGASFDRCRGGAMSRAAVAAGAEVPRDLRHRRHRRFRCQQPSRAATRMGMSITSHSTERRWTLRSRALARRPRARRLAERPPLLRRRQRRRRCESARPNRAGRRESRSAASQRSVASDSTSAASVAVLGPSSGGLCSDIATPCIGVKNVILARDNHFNRFFVSRASVLPLDGSPFSPRRFRWSRPACGPAGRGSIRPFFPDVSVPYVARHTAIQHGIRPRNGAAYGQHRIRAISR